MEAKVINIARDFSRYPAGRYLEDGPYSGQAFREHLLLPALKQHKGTVVVEFDGARGYGSSFLEEAFGGLLRAGIPRNEVSRIELVSKDTSLVAEVNEYIEKQANLSEGNKHRA